MMASKTMSQGKNSNIDQRIRRVNWKNLTVKLLLTIIMLVVSFTMLMPILWMFSASFKFEKDVFEIPIRWIPKAWTFDNYIAAVTEYPYFTWYWNTFKVTVLSNILIVSSSALAGYALARMNFKGKEVITVAFISTLMIPIEVKIIPQFIIFRQLGLYNTHAALILPWIFHGFAIFLLRQFFMGIPFELTEAARIDGCSEFMTFYKIILPVAKPALVSVSVITFVWVWNAFLEPMVFINDVEKQLISVGLSFFQEEYNDNVAIQMAGASLAIWPMVILYLCAQKYFVEGIAMTGIKG